MKKLLLLLSLSSIPTQGLARGAFVAPFANALEKYIPEPVVMLILILLFLYGMYFFLRYAYKHSLIAFDNELKFKYFKAELIGSRKARIVAFIRVLILIALASLLLYLLISLLTNW